MSEKTPAADAGLTEAQVGALRALAEANLATVKPKDDPCACDDCGLSRGILALLADRARLEGELDSAVAERNAANGDSRSTREASMRWQARAEQAEAALAALEGEIHDICPMARRQHLLGASGSAVLKEQINYLFWLEGERDKTNAALAAMTQERDAAVTERDRCWKMREDDNRALARAVKRETERLQTIEQLHDEVRRGDRALMSYEANVRAERERADAAEQSLAEVRGALEAEKADGQIIRKLLWLRHGHDGLYGDDGEMQCGQCRLDFKRQAASAIEQRMYDDGLRAYAEQVAALHAQPVTPLDPSKCDHDVRCSRCGVRWPPQAEVIRDRQAIAAAMEDTVA